MKRFFKGTHILLLLCAAAGMNALVPSCRKQPVLDIAGLSPNESVLTVEQNDFEILRIAQDAQAGLSVFFRHLNGAEEGEYGFCIKYPFPADPDSGTNAEQIWLTGIRFRNNRYYGTLADTPVRISYMKKGDTVTFSPDNITDWMFVKNGEIVGGRSIKYLLEQIPKNRRSEGQNMLLQMFE